MQLLADFTSSSGPVIALMSGRCPLITTVDMCAAPLAITPTTTCTGKTHAKAAANKLLKLQNVHLQNHEFFFIAAKKQHFLMTLAEKAKKIKLQ